LVRRIWQNGLVVGVTRLIRLFVRWLLVWLNYFARKLRQQTRVTGRLLVWLVRPRDPNNLFVVGIDASDYAPDAGIGAPPDVADVAGHTPLLWVADPAKQSVAPNALSLWRGERPVVADEATTGALAANHRFAYLDVLSTQIKRLTPKQIGELEGLIQRLARKWLDIDQQFQPQTKRNRLDVGRTLRYNIPRYAGRILNFQWATKEKPISQLAKPARILIIGDVSHSIVHYVTILLYFFHKLNFRFVVESYVFSERPTHATPFLNGLGTFEEKVERLMKGAASWNAGTKFGSSLQEIAAQATVDEYTYVIIATDGKVSLQGDESIKIERCMKSLRSKAKQVIILTPSAEFSDGAGGKTRPERLGSFKFDFTEIPIYNMGPPLWYGILGDFADRLYLVRTVQDLIEMTDDLILSSKG
jgi:hypothetical protein